MVGYTIQVSASSTNDSTQGNTQLCSFTPTQLAPVGSVWIVNANINALISGTVNLQIFGCQTSTTSTGWSANNQGTPGIGMQMCSNTTFSGQRSHQSVSGIYVNTSASNYILCGHLWYSNTGSASMTRQTYMTATRIA